MASFVLPQNEKDRKTILDAMQEISNSMTRVEGEKDYIKETMNDLSKKFNIPKKHLAKFAKAHHKQNYNQTVSEQEDFEELVQVLVPGAINQE